MSFDARTHLFANNALTRLAVGVAPSDTTLEVVAGAGALFPVPTYGEIFKLTVENFSTGAREIMHVVDVTGDVFTVERAQEGTSAETFAADASTIVSCRLTAGTLEYLASLGGGTGVPAGGTTGQVLTKSSNADGDYDWATPGGGGDTSLFFGNFEDNGSSLTLISGTSNIATWGLTRYQDGYYDFNPNLGTNDFVVQVTLVTSSPDGASAGVILSGNHIFVHIKDAGGNFVNPGGFHLTVKRLS